MPQRNETDDSAKAREEAQALLRELARAIGRDLARREHAAWLEERRLASVSK